ncbi:nucleotidyl cyclase domain-containing protein [Paenisporosarcina antarctica]|uniref:Adenylate/guanylate cyclase domain-containing protein n=1 Tax=Paenisporosarcina antarctica TaxID=417367 RepID=A0A4P7A2K0_9BACL|nr:hypothetical protein [Paenisporosarcina antarctica]QBP43171.1 hypothetical protein E2636_18605 [Paenisporosarcina antarctica]
MTELRKGNVPIHKLIKDGKILESLIYSDLKKSFSITDIPTEKIGTYEDFPAATVVFDLSGSSLSIRNRGAKKFAAESQYLFKGITDIIYTHDGIIEKFPGDGISMHFPAKNSEKDDSVNAERAIKNACKSIMMIDLFLSTKMNMDRSKYRFSLSYGEDTIITIFGSLKHQELISIGHAVNVAHKLEKIIKNANCFVGMDEICKEIAESKYDFSFSVCKTLPIDLKRNEHGNPEFWYGVVY